MSEKAEAKQADIEIVERYTDQPSRLPDDVRSAIEELWGGQAVQLYALADLDASMNLARDWVAIGREHVAVAREGEGAPPRITSFERDRVKAISETPGLSCAVLRLLSDEDEAALAIVRYTHRQRRAMENIKFVLEQQIEGHDVATADADDVYARAIAHPVKQAQAAVSHHRLAVFWRLLSYLKPYRTRVIVGAVASAAMTVVSLAPPWLTSRLIDDIIKPTNEGSLTMDQAMKLVWIIIGALAAVFVLREACLWVRLRLMTVLGEYIAGDLRRSLYEHIQKLSLTFFSSKQTGSIISRVSHDTDRLWDFIAFGVVEVTLSAIMLVGLGVVLLALDWRLGLVMTLPVPLLLFSFFVHGRTLNRIFLRAWRKWSGLSDVISDTIPGMRVVKAFNQELREVRRFNKRNENCVREFNNIHAVWTRFWPALMLGIHAMTLAVWIFAAPRLVGVEGAAPLSLGKFVGFMLYMGMFFAPIETIGMATRMMNRATSSAMRIFEILDTEPEIVDVVEPVRLDPVQGRVTFENVTFAYDGVRQVLRGVSFDAKPGEMIGLVGPSGAGKTTVINMIARFYEPTSGRVLIDGHDVRDLDTGHFRRQIGMVLQDPHLFHGTILDNIRYGVPEATLDDVVNAARTANAHDFICRLPHGYDTTVGERGHTLSGGERQRVSIARAVLNNPRVLILDEATSSVDTETERKIQEALERLIEDRTVFAIAHRLSTLRRASRLFVMKDGRLVEEGDHGELLEKEDGVYRKLHDLQHELHEMYAV